MRHSAIKSARRKSKTRAASAPKDKPKDALTSTTDTVDDQSMDVDDAGAAAASIVDAADVYVDMADSSSSDADGFAMTSTQLLVYQLRPDGSIIPQPVSTRLLFEGNAPLQICAIPHQAMIDMDGTPLNEMLNESATSTATASTQSANNTTTDSLDNFGSSSDDSSAAAAAAAEAAAAAAATGSTTVSGVGQRMPNAVPPPGADLRRGGFAMVCTDGSLQLLALLSLRTVSERFRKSNYVSATYCRSVERLCAGTADGQLHFFSCFAESDSEAEDGDDDLVYDAVDQAIDEGFEMGERAAALVEKQKQMRVCENSSESTVDGGAETGGADAPLRAAGNVTVDPAATAAPRSPVPQTTGAHDLTLLANRGQLRLADLRRLYALTLCDEVPVSFAAEVPGTWSELTAATNKHRRHAMRTNGGGAGGTDADVCRTKSWRVHNDV